MHHFKSTSIMYSFFVVTLVFVLFLLGACTSKTVPTPTSEVGVGDADSSNMIPAKDVTKTQRSLRTVWGYLGTDIERAKKVMADLEFRVRDGIEKTEWDVLKFALLVKESLQNAELQLQNLPATSTFIKAHKNTENQLTAFVIGKRMALLKADFYMQKKRNKSAILELAEVLNLLPKDHWSNIMGKIWYLINRIQQQESLDSVVTEELASLPGWLDAKKMGVNLLSSYDQQQAYLEWKKKWGDHPLAIRPPQVLSTLPEVWRIQPKNIGVFIPLQGPLATIGRAIRDGIMASYYKNQRGFSSRQIKLTFYDTYKTDIIKTFQVAVADGMDAMIGPLQKEKIAPILQSQNPGIRILSLNYLDDEASTEEQFYQFGLNTEDEIEQSIEQIRSESKKRVILLYQNNDWGQKQAEFFRQRWTGQDEQIVVEEQLKNSKSAREIIARVMLVKESQARRKKIRRIIGSSISEFRPRVREDIDFVFLLCNNELANAVKPALAYYYSGDIPVYSTSRIVDNKSALNEPDLQGIYYTDMPWNLEQSSVKSFLVESEYETNELASFFYALGLDAFNIMLRLNQYQQIPNLELKGETGWISIKSGKKFSRRLIFTQIPKKDVAVGL